MWVVLDVESESMYRTGCNGNVAVGNSGGRWSCHRDSGKVNSKVWHGLVAAPEIDGVFRVPLEGEHGAGADIGH